MFKDTKRALRRHHERRAQLRRLRVDRREHRAPNDLSGADLSRVCPCFWHPRFMGKFKNHAVNVGWLSEYLHFAVPYFWGGVRMREREALAKFEEPQPTRTRNSVRWKAA